jgi:hypothetical protein
MTYFGLAAMREPWTTVRVDRQTDDASMDENRAEGIARHAGGKVQEGFGKVTGNVRTQAEGLVN